MTLCSRILAIAALVCSFGQAAHADFESGQKAYAKGDFRKAFLEWQVDADKGNPVAQYLIGNMYASGEGVDQDMEVANSYYLKAAEQGHVESAVRLATNHRFGQGFDDVDLHQATKWLYMAAEAGHPIARYDLGELFLYGDPPHQLWPEPYHASQWYRMAARDGVALARFKLAQLYFEGKGVDKDPVEGLVWLTLAGYIASGEEPENKWSKMAMPMDMLVPGDDEERVLSVFILDTLREKKAELGDEVVVKAEAILKSGAPEKLR